MIQYDEKHLELISGVILSQLRIQTTPNLLNERVLTNETVNYHALAPG